MTQPSVCLGETCEFGLFPAALKPRTAPQETPALGKPESAFRALTQDILAACTGAALPHGQAGFLQLRRISSQLSGPTGVPGLWGLWTAALNPAQPTEDSGSEECPHFGSPRLAFHHCRDFPRPRTRMFPGGALSISSPCSLGLGKVLERPISGVLISSVSILVILEFWAHI